MINKIQGSKQILMLILKLKIFKTKVIRTKIKLRKILREFNLILTNIRGSKLITRTIINKLITTI